MPQMIVRVLGDTTSFKRSLRQAGTDAKGLAVDVNALARAQVEASTKSSARLREQAAAYRQLASTATRGSAEQAEALRLAERAERGFVTETHRATSAHRELRHEVEGGIRGTLSASGAFEHLGRSLAFASGGFVATAGIGEFLRSSIDAARDAQKAQASLAAQMRASGESFRENKQRVEETSLAYAKFGFNNDDVVKSLVVLERGSGNITRAIHLQGLAADIARAKNIDLAAAANVVAKVFGGQETALRRAVPGLQKNAHGLELIRLAQERLKGQAAANTTAAERFSATLHDTEEVIGTALLPILDKYLESLSNWLDKMNRSGRLQRDVNEAVRTGEQVIGGLKDVVTPLADAFKGLGDAVGGTKNEVELLAAAFAAFKFTGMLKGLGLIGKTAGTSTREVKLLGLAISRLPVLTVLTIAIEVVIHRKQIEKAISDAVKAVTTQGAPSPLGLPFSLDPLDTRPGSGGQIPRAHFNFPGGPDIPTLDRNGDPIQRLAGIPQARGVGFTGPRPLTDAQKFALAIGAHPDDLKLLREQADRDRAAIAFAARLRARGSISNKRYVEEVGAYQSDLQGTLNHINSINEEAARKAAEAARKAAAAAKKEREAARKAEEARIARLHAALKIPDNLFIHGETNVAGTQFFRDLSPLKIPAASGSVQFQRQSFAIPIGLQIREAKAQAQNDTSGFRAALQQAKRATLRALHSGKLSLDATRDAWNTLADINDQLGQQTGAVTEKAKLSARKFAASITGLDRAQRIAVEARFSQVQAHGGARPTHLTIQGQATTIINVNGAGDPDRVADKVSEKIGRANRARGTTTRGAHAGRGHLDA